MLNTQKRNIVISVVGDDSYHKYWLEGDRRNFDLMLIYYGIRKCAYKKDADYYFELQGLFKLEAIAEAINRAHDIVRQYGAVFLPDDDIIMSAREISSLFNIFYKYNLDLAQPAVSGGIINYPITRQNKNCILRYVNFIEMMCPIFKTDILLAIADTFTMTRSGWGIDHLWSKLLKDKKLAIIDSIAIYHGKNRKSREGGYYRKLAALGINPVEELSLICRQYDCDFRCKMIEYSIISMPMLDRILSIVNKPLKRIYYSIKIRGMFETIKYIPIKYLRIKIPWRN